MILMECLSSSLGCRRQHPMAVAKQTPHHTGALFDGHETVSCVLFDCVTLSHGWFLQCFTQFV